LVELVRGEIDAFLAEGFHIWDHAPWVLLAEEAGGRFTDRTGGRASDRGGGLYSNAGLHGQLLALLQYPMRERKERAP
jgi:histidinol-phosphatase